MATDPQSMKDSFKQQLHPELLAVLSTRKPARDGLHIDGWRPSFLGRVLEMLAGKRSR